MFSVAIHSTCIKEKMYKIKLPRKNQHWIYFYNSILKVWPFGHPPVALGLTIKFAPKITLWAVNSVHVGSYIAHKWGKKMYTTKCH